MGAVWARWEHTRKANRGGLGQQGASRGAEQLQGRGVCAAGRAGMHQTTDANIYIDNYAVQRWYKGGQGTKGGTLEGGPRSR